MVTMILSLLLFSLAVSTNALEPCEIVGQLKGDPEICEKFYQCTHNGWSPLFCQDGLFFNEDISVCDNPVPGTKCWKGLDGNGNNVGVTENKLEACEVVGQLKGDENNCQMFYQCTHTGWAPLTCESGLFFNEEISVCDWPKEGYKCGKETHTDDNSGNGHESQNDESGSVACDEVGKLRGDEQDCQKFYQCTHNGWAPLSCDFGLFFNEEISVCDWPKAGTKCGRDIHTDDHSADGQQGRDEKPEFDACDEVGKLKGDEQDCQKFYQCTHTGWVPLKCDNGLFFNEEISVCDWPKEGYKCGKETHTDDNSGDHNQDDESNQQSCQIIGQLKGDEKDCQIFYECTNSGWQQLRCKDGLFFNPKIEVCDWPEDGFKCGSHNDNDHDHDDDDHEVDLDPCMKLGNMKPDTEHCDLYYQCTSCGWSLKPCESGLLFNPKTSICDKPERVTCAREGDLVPCNKLGEVKPSEQHCDTYQKCTKCGWTLVKCGSGLHFDMELGVCANPEEANCAINNDDNNSKLEPCKEIGKLKADSENCGHYFNCTKKGWGSLPCKSGYLFNSKTLACEIASQVKCGNDDDDDHSGDQDHDQDKDKDQNQDQHNDDDHNDGPLEPCEEISALKSDPKDCHRYYQCTTYGWQNMPCYDGLVYNSRKSICDYAYNAPCTNN